MATINLTMNDKQLNTVLPDGTLIRTYSELGPDGWGADHRIGERKRISFEYGSDHDLNGCMIYINPALFLPTNYVNTITGKGSMYYVVQFPSVGTVGIPYVASLQSTSTVSGPVDNANNFEVLIIPDGDGSGTFLFTLQIDFYMTADVKGYLTAGVPYINEDRFLKDAFDNPTTLDIYNSNRNLFAVPNNVYYAENRSPRVYFYIEDPAVPFPGMNVAREEKFFGFRAGWFYRDALNAQPWFTNTHFRVIRNSNIVNNLSASGVNDMEIRANSDSALNPVTHFLVGIVQYYVNDQSVDFVQSGHIEWQWIKASNPGSGKIVGPMTDPADQSLNEWMSSFKVQGLDLNGGYRFIGIAYSSVFGQTFRCNSFISPLYFVDAAPEPTGDGFTAIASLDDYNNEYRGNNLECVIEERMRSKIKLQFPFDQWKNYLFDRFGLVATNDIREYLEAIELIMYEEYVDPLTGANVTNIFDLQYAGKNGITNTFGPVSGMTTTFDNVSAELIYEWRNRWEHNIQNPQSIINNLSQTPGITDQYWGGRTIKIQWNLYFIFNQFAVTDKVSFNQQIRVKDYGEMSVKHVGVDDFDPQLSICSGVADACFAGILQNPSLTDMKLIANIMPLGAGVNAIEESEVWAGNQLPQLTTNKIINEEEDYAFLFSETAAKFCLDTSKLVVNSQYQISAIAKKFVDTGYRIIETGERRITEDNGKRIIE